MKKKKRQQSKQPKWLQFLTGLSITCALVTLLPILFGSISMMGYSDIKPPPTSVCDPSIPSQFEDFANVELPPSFDDLNAYCGGGFMSEGSQANFTIAPDDLDLFLQSTFIEQSLTTDLPEHIQTNFAEQIELNPDSILYAYHRNETYSQEIIVNTSVANRWRVYFTQENVTNMTPSP